VMPVVSLGDCSPLQYHGPVPTAGLLAATQLMFWTVTPPMRAPLVISQSFHAWKPPKSLKSSTQVVNNFLNACCYCISLIIWVSFLALS
jgi:hypothetical protein